jgi:hypothetical protein
MPLEVQCDYCNKTCYKRNVTEALKSKNLFCSPECHRKYIQKNNVTKPCSHCGKMVTRYICDVKKCSGNIFCNHSCSATYQNTHKTTGTRVSKLEIYLQKRLKEIYPNINFIFNGKEEINSELDISLPDYHLAFELNGIFHYEPIYGQHKLDQIRNNDDRKFQACLERGIELVIIDSSSMKVFKERRAEKFVGIIKNIIDKKVHPTGSAPVV